MQSTDRSVARATLLVVVSACCFGSLTTIVLFATRTGMSLVTAMFWRYLLAALILMMLVRTAPRAAISRRQAAWLRLTGGLAQAVITYLSLLALDYMPVALLAFLFYTYPAWLTAISATRGKEPLTSTRVIALAIAMGGIVVMVGAPSAGSLNPTGLALAAVRRCCMRFTCRQSPARRRAFQQLRQPSISLRELRRRSSSLVSQPESLDCRKLQHSGDTSYYLLSSAQ